MSCIEWCITLCGFAIYTRFEHLKENLLQKLFPEVVYFQKSSEHAIFFLSQPACSCCVFWMGLQTHTHMSVCKGTCMCYSVCEMMWLCPRQVVGGCLYLGWSPGCWVAVFKGRDLSDVAKPRGTPSRINNRLISYGLLLLTSPPCAIYFCVSPFLTVM